VLTRQLDWRVEILATNWTDVGGVLHWYQTSGKEVGAGWERHLSFAQTRWGYA
jgi:hypothetical protein